MFAVITAFNVANVLAKAKAKGHCEDTWKANEANAVLYGEKTVLLTCWNTENKRRITILERKTFHVKLNFIVFM